jgi:predicted metal-dependent hydrolase
LHDPSKDAVFVVRDWLKKEAPYLKKYLAKVRNRKEYGVQLMWNSRSIADELLQGEQELISLRQDIASKPEGAAYMFREKLERLLKDKLEALATKKHHELQEKIHPFCADYKVERNKKSEDGYEMIGNWSFLVAPDQVESLGSALEKFSKMKGYKVRFTGPWPPYSFVN